MDASHIAENQVRRRRQRSSSGVSESAEPRPGLDHSAQIPEGCVKNEVARSQRSSQKEINADMDCKLSQEKETRKRQPRVSFQSLPTELHLMISKNLIYPDALALKHTNRHFYCLVDTGINLKVDWLEWRFKLHLYCPRDNRCDLGSDQRFCRGSYRLLMQRYREHDECDVTGREGGRGCLVYGTKICTSRKELSRFGKAKKFAQGLRSWNVLLWWFSVAVAGLLMAWIWMMKYPVLTSGMSGNTTETGTIPTATVDAATI